MVELLLVLVIIALLGGVVVPNISKWVSSREVAEQRSSLAIEIASLPPKAYFSQTPITIDTASKLSTVSDGSICIIEPIKVLSNGYCVGGKLLLNTKGTDYEITISPLFVR